MRFLGRAYSRFSGLEARLSSSKTWQSLRLHSTEQLSQNEVTPVERLLRSTIKATGPVSFSSFMQLCLSHPTHGYYMSASNPIFGARGDFITSPEISQVFGELIGIWLIQQWMSAGSPSSVRLIELGPGRGTLLDDILRIINTLSRKHPFSERSAKLVETSPYLREIQNNKLSKWTAEGWSLDWFDSMQDIPTASTPTYTMLVAHEFFDALPIYVIQRKESGWHELRITTESQDNSETLAAEQREPPLITALSPEPSTQASYLSQSSSHLSRTSVGETRETSLAAWTAIRQVGEILSAPSSIGGCALVIDYGADHAFSDSFRAFKDHKQVSPFYRPGECDLTANVDFAYLRESINLIGNSRLKCHGPVTQADFLARMGLSVRVNQLVQNSPDHEKRKRIVDSAERLVSVGPRGMGNEYVAFGVVCRPDGSLVDDDEVYPFFY